MNSKVKNLKHLVSDKKFLSIEKKMYKERKRYNTLQNYSTNVNGKRSFDIAFNNLTMEEAKIKLEEAFLNASKELVIPIGELKFSKFSSGYGGSIVGKRMQTEIEYEQLIQNDIYWELEKIRRNVEQKQDDIDI